MAKNKYDFDVRRFVSSRDKNQYLLVSRSEAAVIDVSDSLGEITRTVDNMGVSLKYLLITHAHPSHLQALPELQLNYDASFCLHEYEFELLQSSESSPEPNQVLNDGDRLRLGDIEIEVLLTAGHTKGSCCYHIPRADALFSGSTFLKRGYGKIWGPKSMSLMLFSLKRLSYNIPAKTTIYTGSGDLTRMGDEGWIQCLRSV